MRGTKAERKSRETKKQRNNGGGGVEARKRDGEEERDMKTLGRRNVERKTKEALLQYLRLLLCNYVYFPIFVCPSVYTKWRILQMQVTHIKDALSTYRWHGPWASCMDIMPMCAAGMHLWQANAYRVKRAYLLNNAQRSDRPTECAWKLETHYCSSRRCAAALGAAGQEQLSESGKWSSCRRHRAVISDDRNWKKRNSNDRHIPFGILGHLLLVMKLHFLLIFLCIKVSQIYH
jgi:hypothetical protein